VAAIGQELPFPNASFDRVLGLFSVTRYTRPEENKEAALRWAMEVVRVLRDGGEARLGPIYLDKQYTREVYTDIADEIQRAGATFELEEFGPQGVNPNLRIVLRKPRPAERR